LIRHTQLQLKRSAFTTKPSKRTYFGKTRLQARNQLGTPGGAKSCPRGAQIFWTLSNTFKLCPTHFSSGGVKICLGGASPPLVTACAFGLYYGTELFLGRHV